MSVLISCVMPTYNRPQFLPMALKCFVRQTWQNRELIVVDDSPSEMRALPPVGVTNLGHGVRVIRLGDRETIGAKLNIGIAAAHGDIIQKLDDDDWYSPEFLEVMHNRVIGDRNSICALNDFTVLALPDLTLRYSGQGWAAGGTMCFWKSLWETGKFDESLEAGSDYQFFQDHPGAKRPMMMGPEEYILVRHAGRQTWREVRGLPAADFFGSLPPYKKPLHAVIPEEDVKFYQELK